jgi:hypothetical protein
MAKLLPLMNVRQVYFDCRQRDGGNRISNCDTGMCVTGWIHHYSIEVTPGVLNPGHQFSFHIRLFAFYDNPQRRGMTDDGLIDLCQRQVTVDGWFSRPQEIEIGPMKHKYPQHISIARLG